LIKRLNKFRIVDSDDSKTLCYIEGNLSFKQLKAIVQKLVDRDNKNPEIEGRDLFKLMQQINSEGFKAIFINVNEVVF